MLIENQNKQKVNEYTKALALLNKVVPSKNVNETDEQYVQRLAHYQYDAGNVDEAEMFEKNTLKKELGKLTKLPLYSLENIVKSLSKDLILSLNERWPLVTSEYNKLFSGDVRESSVIEFLQNIFIPEVLNIPSVPLLTYKPTKLKRSISIKQIDDITAAGYKKLPKFKSMKVNEQYIYLENIGANVFQNSTKKENLIMYEEFLMNRGLI